MKKILNIGSINIDYVYDVPHFVRAGETLASHAMQVFPGGKGLNQSVALARAGGRVFHAGCIGPEGEEMRRLLDGAGVDTTQVLTGEVPTGHAIIQVEGGGQNCILLYAGANHALTERQIDDALSGFGAGDILVLQNEVNLLGYCMQAAHQKGMQIALNPSPFNDEILQLPLQYVRWFLVNEIEGAAIAGSGEPKEILEAMARRYPTAAVVLTVGKNGVYYRDGDKTLHHGIYKVPVVDTTAAGDTFTGFFLSSVAAGQSAEEALRVASVASSLAVARKGAAVSIPTLDEVRAAKLDPME